VSITVFAWNDYSGSTGGLVQYDNRLRVATLEVTMMAEEFAAGSGVVELDDTTSDFYVYGFRPIYFVESAAVGDGFLGIIGPFWTEGRKWQRDNERTDIRRTVQISVRDINSLLNLRVQKGGDAQRDAETDVERGTWLINTAEVIGGHGDNGYTIEETEFFFTDAPVNMSESDYTGQYSNGVLDDCMQQSGANGYLYSSPLEAEPLRIGIWYGRTERSEFASLHKISNDLADISPEVLTGFDGETPQYDTGYVFPPSLDATLDRDPSRQITGAMVQYDGDYIYTSNPAPALSLTRRDMSFGGELVKNATQALARATRYVTDLATEDDAIECAVQVPDWLVHAFVAGQRVQFKATHLADLGYGEYVWMRVAAVTVRQLQGEDTDAHGWYELALDLRSETPPGPAAPEPPGPTPCADDTPGWEAQTFCPLGAGENNNAAATPEPGAIQYWRAGIERIWEPSTTHINSWHFHDLGSGGCGTQDGAGRGTTNKLRIVVPGPGTLTVNAFFTGNTTGSWSLDCREGLTEITEQSGSGIPGPVSVPLDDHCYHTLVIHVGNGTSGGFYFVNAGWEPDVS
jgi:hypothetical protein